MGGGGRRCRRARRTGAGKSASAGSDLVPGDLPFPMPVPVRLAERTALVDMTDGVGTLQVPAGSEPVSDPENWVLRARPGPGPLE